MNWMRWLFPAAEASIVQPIFHADGVEGDLLTALRQVVDPETGKDVVSMGLIRGLEVEGERARITLTLTTRGCPMADYILDEITFEVRDAGLHPHLELSFDPPWSPEQMES